MPFCHTEKKATAILVLQWNYAAKYNGFSKNSPKFSDGTRGA